MMNKQKEMELRDVIFKALDKATTDASEAEIVRMEWTDNIVSLMTDAAVSVLLAAEETYRAPHVRE